MTTPGDCTHWFVWRGDPIMVWPCAVVDALVGDNFSDHNATITLGAEAMRLVVSRPTATFDSLTGRLSVGRKRLFTTREDAERYAAMLALGLDEAS